MKSADDDDVRAIRALIARQFGSMSWIADGAPDLAAFEADFLAEAPLYASARPVQAQSVGQFTDRMRGLAADGLRSFDETVLGSIVHVFGNVAIAAVACENVENGAETNRNVEMMLLVRDGGAWRIAAQAWDRETASNPIPAEFLASEVAEEV